jgi:hypothetical protein
MASTQEKPRNSEYWHVNLEWFKVDPSVAFDEEEKSRRDLFEDLIGAYRWTAALSTWASLVLYAPLQPPILPAANISPANASLAIKRPRIWRYRRSALPPADVVEALRAYRERQS